MINNIHNYKVINVDWTSFPLGCRLTTNCIHVNYLFVGYNDSNEFNGNYYCTAINVKNFFLNMTIYI